jgi:hypothetical protein
MGYEMWPLLDTCCVRIATSACIGCKPNPKIIMYFYFEPVACYEPLSFHFHLHRKISTRIAISFAGNLASLYFLE